MKKSESREIVKLFRAAANHVAPNRQAENRIAASSSGAGTLLKQAKRLSKEADALLR
jgi:hypothetical protein